MYPFSAPELATIQAVISMVCMFLAILLLLHVRMQKQARASQKRMEEALEYLGEGFYRAAMDGSILYVNRALAALNGYDDPQTCIREIGKGAAQLYVDPARGREFHERLRKEGRLTDFISQIRRHRTGEPIWISENARIVCDPKDGKPIYYEGSLRDMTHQAERRETERRLEKLASNLPGGLFQLVRQANGQFSVPYLSDGFLQLLGLEEARDVSDPNAYLHKIHDDDLKSYLYELRKSAHSLNHLSIEFRYFPQPGTMLWLQIGATPERNSDGSIIWHGHVTDISERKKTEEKIRHLADFDTLTELPNRRVFNRNLARVLEHSARSGDHSAVLFIDLDNFKALNDTHGHEFGDELLRVVARRLQSCIRGSDTASRFGGDEFVLLIEELGKDRDEALSSARGTANKILREFATSFQLGEISFTTSPSIGAIVFQGNEQSPSQIIRSADIAMYEAKRSGKNRFVLFDPSDLKDVADGYELQGELRHAIAKDQLYFDFQPQVDETGKIVACEALARWRHPTRGRLLPAEFIPMAETTGMIRDINEWVVRRAVQTLAEWKRIPGLSELDLSINISVQQLRSSEFVHRLIEQLRVSGVNPTRLTLEVTEHAIARDPEIVATNMHQLKANGIGFSLDDFGTGYSSLSQLNQYPFNEIKIDGAFVADLENNHSNRSLVEAILGMANALNLETVAEHVGSPFQIDFLQERGCNRFQGFYFHPPMSMADLQGALTEAPKRSFPPLSIVK